MTHEHTPATRAQYLKRRALVIIGLFAIFGAGIFVGFHAPVSGALFKKQDPSTSASVSLTPFWQVWKLLQDKYPFPDRMPTDQEKLYGAIQGLVSSYDDPYTTFFPPSQAKIFAEDVKGSFGGAGMEIGVRNDLVTVIAPLKGSPAEKAGVKAGDIIIKIDSTSTEGMALDDVVSRIRGKEGTPVRVTYIRPSQQGEQTVTIVREVIKLPIVTTRTTGPTYVIELSSFSEQSAVLFKNALGEFATSGASNLIIDLRNNPGGYLDAAVDIASYFLPEGKVVVRENMGEGKDEITHRTKGGQIVKKGTPIVVLVNHGSASAAEILAGALSEHGIATLIGEKTFGKGSVQELIDLPDGSSVKITVAEWLTPKGVSISKQGLTPTQTVADEKDKLSEKDPVIDAALQFLSNKK